MLAPTFLRNSEIIRFDGTPFFTGDGSTSSATLIDRHGNPISSGKLKSVKSVHRTDWQGRQLLYATARTNLQTYSQQLDNAAWNKATGGTGTAPVVTADFALAPDGTTTADRVQFNIAAGTTSADISQLSGQATTGLTLGATYTDSFWLRTNDGSTVSMRLVDAAGQSPLVVITPIWTRFSSSSAAIATTVSGIRLRLRGNEITSKSADVLVWAGQREMAAAPTPYIATTSSSRTVTDYTLSGPSVSFGEAPVTGAVCDWDGVAKR